MFTNPPTPSLHSEVQLHSTDAVVNQLSCAPDAQGWLAATLAATSFQLLHLCLWTCATWNHHLRHMRYLMHTYAPTPQSSLWDTVSKSSLKPRISEGFSSTVPIPYPQKIVSKDMWMKTYREDSAQNQGMGFRSMEKSLIWVEGECNDRENEEQHQ